MGTFNKDKKTKKAGPKGKKARKQAKLDNRWGETVATEDTEIQKKTRRGKTATALKGQINRKLSQHSNQSIETFYLKVAQGHERYKTPAAVPKRRQRKVYQDDSSNCSGSDDDDSNDGFQDPENDDDDMDMTNPMGDLLSMIRSKGTTNRVENEDDSYDDESGSDSDSYDEDEDSEDDDQAMQEDDEASVQGEDATSDNKNNNLSIDFFKKRFGRPALTKSELFQLEEEKPLVKKISCGKHSELQFTVSENSNDYTMCSDLLHLDNTPEAWQAIAKESFSGTREVLQKHWVNGKNQQQQQKPLSDSQAPIYSCLARYADVLDVTACTGKGHDYSKSDRHHQIKQHRLQILHVLNHVLTSRTRIGRNNKYVKELEEKRAKAEESDVEKFPAVATEENNRDIRDQGFTRPSVLVLLPTRMTCHKFVKDLYKLSGAHMEEAQEDRFDADYGELIDEDENENNNASKNDKVERHRKAALESKGKEWNEFFGDKANQDDDFKIGISLIPKTAASNTNKSNNSNVTIKLYSDFFKSDIIVASPLGLKMLLVPEGNDENDDDDDSQDGDSGTRKGNFDYLSSIEICLLQHSEVILMQNWEHVNDILACLNTEPKNNNNTDFSRVRNYLLEGQGARWRQLIVSSKFWDPSLLNTFKRFGKSLSGQVKVRQKIRDGDASISGVLVPLKQVFQKIPTGNFAQQSKTRVDYFIKHLLPQLERNDQTHTLVYIPSYFDFLALRNALLKLEKKHKFVSITEYARPTEINRGRARFLQGRKPILLYTGRAHFFHRHLLKGIRNLIFLGLPEHSEFYAQYVNRIQTSRDELESNGEQDTSCIALFTKYEAHALERVVGSSNASKMLSSENSVFMFHS